MKHRIKGIIMLILAISMLIIDLILWIRHDKIEKITDGTKFLSTNWTSVILENAEDSPYFADDKTVYRLITSHPLTEDILNKVISFKTNDSFVDVYLCDTPLTIPQDEPIYHFGVQYSYCDSPGTLYNFIEIPDSDAKYITIRTETVYQKKFLTNYEIACGERNELIYYYLHNELDTSIPNIIMLIFGIMLLVISLTAKVNNISYAEMLSLGCLTIAFSLYTNCPLFLNQYLIQHTAIQYYMYYFLYFLIPPLMFIYFENLVPTLNLSKIFFINIAVQLVLTILHFSGIAAYTRTINIFNADVAISAIVLIIMVARRFKKIPVVNRISMLMLLSFCLINIFFYLFVTTIGNQTFIARAGFLLYQVFAMYNGIKKILESVYKERETTLLEQIAFTDNLTELGNRYALERIVRTQDIEKLSIVSMDLNYLKTINDTFGHAGGDVLLKSAAVALLSVYDHVYRVGGDEFIALVYNADETELQRLSEQLNEKINSMNTQRTEFAEFADKPDFRLSISAGFASYEAGDTSYEQIMQRADKIMYVRKRAIHHR